MTRRPIVSGDWAGASFQEPPDRCPVASIPGHKLQSSFIVGKKSGDPRISLGECGVFVSVGLRDDSPRIALPLDDGDGALRYRSAPSD